MSWIKDLKDGDKVATELLVNNVTKGVTDKGLTYLNISLQDKTGTIEAKKWDASEEDIRQIKVGVILYVEGNVNLYKGTNQLKINNMEVINNISSIDLSRFQRVSPIPFDTMLNKLNNLLNSFTDKDVSLITNTVIKHFYNDYINYPAAVNQYGRTEFYDIFYHTPDAHLLYKISDYVWNEETEKFDEVRDCVPLDMEVIDYSNCLNKYSMFKEEFDKTDWKSKEEFIEYLKSKYRVDENLLNLYSTTYAKEHQIASAALIDKN